MIRKAGRLIQKEELSIKRRREFSECTPYFNKFGVIT